MSDKRRAENRVRREETRPAVMDRSGGRCEIRIPDICTGAAVDMHEVLTRARGGSITDPDNILAACRPCHDHVTDNPEWAAEEGYVRWSWDDDGDGE